MRLMVLLLALMAPAAFADVDYVQGDYARGDVAVQKCGLAQQILGDFIDWRRQGGSPNDLLELARGRDEAVVDFIIAAVAKVYTLERHQLSGDGRERFLTDFFTACLYSQKGAF